MGKKLSGAAKKKKKKETEKAVAEAEADLERLKLGPTRLWTGLVTHHRDIFVSHVLPKLTRTDRILFSKANSEGENVLEYAGVKVSQLAFSISDCTSVSTLEWAWNDIILGGKLLDDGTVKDQAVFCAEVAFTNKLELLKWVREVKKCEWGEDTIDFAALMGNLEMLKYCFANGCAYDETTACRVAAGNGHLDCLRFLFAKVKPSRETEKVTARIATECGQLDILKYFVEERKISDDEKAECVLQSVRKGNLDCVKYLVEEAKARLDYWHYIAHARYFEQPECLYYLREKGCPEPTDAEYTKGADILTSLAETGKERSRVLAHTRRSALASTRTYE
jgi:hypothetical protein